MSRPKVRLSVGEQGKITTYKKAMDDRKKGLVKVAHRVPADGGMVETGDMPSASMHRDKPMLLTGLPQGAMPKLPMNARDKVPQGVSGNEMPHPNME